MSNILRAAALAVCLVSFPAHAETPEEAPDCRNGRAMTLAGQHALAAQHHLACAQIPGQTPFQVAKSRLDRFGALEKLGDRAGAEAELVALTSKPVADYSVFTRAGAQAGSMLSAASKLSVGVTQPRLLAVRASYRLAAEDKPAAAALAERAMRTAEHNPAGAMEIAAAFAARGKVRFLDKNEKGAIADIVAAYLRGSEDSWVTGQVAGFPADAKAHFAALRKLMGEQAGAYLQATSTMSLLTQPKEKVEETVKQAEAALTMIETEEARLLGAPTWDTQP